MGIYSKYYEKKGSLGDWILKFSESIRLISSYSCNKYNSHYVTTILSNNTHINVDNNLKKCVTKINVISRLIHQNNKIHRETKIETLSVSLFKHIQITS